MKQLRMTILLTLTEEQFQHEEVQEMIDAGSTADLSEMAQEDFGDISTTVEASISVRDI